MNYLREKLLSHLGHSIVIAAYGNPEDPVDICVECEDCGEVLISSEDYDLVAVK